MQVVLLKSLTLKGIRIELDFCKTSSQKKMNASSSEIPTEIPAKKAKGSSLSKLDAAKGHKNSVLEEMMNLKQTSGGNDCNDERRTKNKHDKLQNTVNKGTKRMRETESALPSGVQTDNDRDKRRKQIAEKVAESANVQGNDAKKVQGKGKKFARNDAKDDACRPSVQRVLCLKRGPRKFVEAIESRNDDQRDAVEDMGYMRLEDNGRQKTNKFINEIAESVGRMRSKMGAKMLTDMMLSDIYEGEKFRKIFLILVDTILINPSGDGYLHTQIEEVIHDIDNVKEYNWCGIVLRSRPVTRTFPTIKGWTSTLIHECEKLELEPGPFGRGIEEPIFDPRRCYMSEEPAKENIVSSSGAKPKDISLTTQRRSTVVNLMGKAVDVLGELIKELEDGADDLKNDGCSKVAAKCSVKMMGLHEMEPEEEANDFQSMSQEMEEDHLDNPEFIAVVKKVDTTPTRDIDPGNYIFEALQFMHVQDLDKGRSCTCLLFILDEDIPPSIINVDAGLRGNLEVDLVAECVVQHGANMRSHIDNEPKDDGAKEIDMDVDFMDSGPVGKPVGTEIIVYNANKEKNIPMADVTRSSNFNVDAGLRGNLEVNLVVENANVAAEIQSVIDAYKEIDMDDDFMDSGPVGNPVGTEVIVYNANKRNAIAVIDNSANGDDNDLTINYGHIPETLVRILLL
ncbi:hypothetical protein SASPL_104986 [Salvia splendens]|uniref:Uncharacterized protein n=1 Tax=Salvia splendens TaxID=180675 RepID=A0A8X8YKG3_SALSN|nr:hypothetical protein SASPL_104986 [Salvia splendens]